MTDGAPSPAPGAAADLVPTPADQARAQIEALKADPAWVQKHLAGSHETKAELARLHEIAYAPAQGSIRVGGPTPEAQRAEQADHLGIMSDLPAAVIDQVRQGQPVTAEEYRLAVGRKNSLFADPAWRDRYFRGDHEARQQKLLLDVILSSPIRLGA
jgi:hypothetical protein